MLTDTLRIQNLVDCLYEQVSRGHVENDWEENFICDMKSKVDHGCNLSEKQITKLEELFERY